MEVRQARRHVEHGRTSKLSRSSSTASSFAAAGGAQSSNHLYAGPPCVYGAARMPTHLQHKRSALAQGKWLEEAEGRKIRGKFKSGRKTGFSGALAAPIH